MKSSGTRAARAIGASWIGMSRVFPSISLPVASRAVGRSVAHGKDLPVGLYLYPPLVRVDNVS